jgi:hypothetical protein
LLDAAQAVQRGTPAVPGVGIRNQAGREVFQAGNNLQLCRILNVAITTKALLVSNANVQTTLIFVFARLRLPGKITLRD